MPQIESFISMSRCVKCYAIGCLHGTYQESSSNQSGQHSEEIGTGAHGEHGRGWGWRGGRSHGGHHHPHGHHHVAAGKKRVP